MPQIAILRYTERETRLFKNKNGVVINPYHYATYFSEIFSFSQIILFRKVLTLGFALSRTSLLLKSA